MLCSDCISYIGVDCAMLRLYQLHRVDCAMLKEYQLHMVDYYVYTVSVTQGCLCYAQTVLVT